MSSHSIARTYLSDSVPEANPAISDEAGAFLEDRILDVVINRGPIHRPRPA